MGFRVICGTRPWPLKFGSRINYHLLFRLGWGMCFCVDTFDLWETLLWSSYIKPEGAFPHLSFTVVWRTSFSLALGFIFCFSSGPQSNWSLYIISICSYDYLYKIHVYICKHVHKHVYIHYRASTRTLLMSNAPWCPCSHEAAHGALLGIIPVTDQCTSVCLIALLPWRPSLIHVENHLLPPSVFAMTFSGFPFWRNPG